MPIYEYEREDGTVFEQMQKITDEPLTNCPTTGQKVQRLVSASAFHLKGTGWYKTDYAGASEPSDSNSNNTDAGNDTDGSAGDSANESSSEPKSAGEDKSAGSDKTETTPVKKPEKSSASGGE